MGRALAHLSDQNIMLLQGGGLDYRGPGWELRRMCWYLGGLVWICCFLGAFLYVLVI